MACHRRPRASIGWAVIFGRHPEGWARRGDTSMTRDCCRAHTLFAAVNRREKCVHIHTLHGLEWAMCASPCLDLGLGPASFPRAAGCLSCSRSLPVSLCAIIITKARPLWAAAASHYSAFNRAFICSSSACSLSSSSAVLVASSSASAGAATVCSYQEPCQKGNTAVPSQPLKETSTEELGCGGNI